MGQTTAAPVRIAAIILNYRTPGLVADCLATAVGELRPGEDEILVVDNASGDDSVPRIRAEIERGGWPHVRLVESSKNGGFAAGNNVGIRSVQARAYLLLNSDTLVRPGAVERLWETMQAASDCGMVSPRLEWPDGEPQISCFRLHTPYSEIIQGAQTGPVRKLLSRWDVPIDLSSKPSEPEWTSFAAVLIRREVFDTVGLLDEGFFMYYEDVDYCRMTREAGWRIVNDPTAHVVHLRGGSSPVKALSRALKRRPHYYYQSRARYFRKAFGRLGLLAANSGWTAGRAVAKVREVVGNKQQHTVERELFDTWRG